MYWAQLGGSADSASAVFASYNLSQVVAIPLLSFWLDKAKGKVYWILIITIIINIAGNILYSLAETANSQFFLLIGRIMTGLGSGNLVCGTKYLVDISFTERDRATLMNSYNLSAFWGRLLGPVIALLIFYIPNWSIGGLAMNASTMPAWLTAVLGIICLILLAVFGDFPQPLKYIDESRIGKFEESQPLFESPSPREGRQAMSVAVPSNEEESFFVDYRHSQYSWELTIILIVYVVIMVSFWSWYPNIVVIAFVQYDMAAKYSGNAFLALFSPVMIGLVVGNRFFNLIMKHNLATPHFILMQAQLAMFIGFVLCLNVLGTAEWRYWIGGILLSAAFAMIASLITAAYTRIVERQGSGTHMGAYVGLLNFLVALGRSVGTVWTSWVLSVHVTSLTPNQTCCEYHSISHIDVSCCKLTGINLMFPILIAQIVLGMALSWNFLPQVFAISHDEPEHTEKPHDSLAQS